MATNYKLTICSFLGWITLIMAIVAFIEGRYIYIAVFVAILLGVVAEYVTTSLEENNS